MIGVGVFTTSGFSIGDLQSPAYVWLAWLVGGVISICGAISYSALGKHFRQSGGEYLFLSRGIHPAAGYIAGWVSLTAGFSGAIAASARGFASYFLPLLDPSLNGSDDPQLFMIAAITVITVAACCHALQLGIGLATQNVLVAIKLILLAALIVIGLSAPNVADTTAPFDLQKFAVAVMWISLSYAGYNAVVYAASEVRNVEKTLPAATIFGTVLVTVFYLLLNYIFVYKTPTSAISYQEDVAAICARHIGGSPLELFTRLVISLSLLTSTFAMVMIGPRVYALMAQDRFLPALLRDGSSPIAIWLQAVLAIVIVSIVLFKDLLSYLGFTLSISSALSICTLFVLRYRGQKIRTIGWPVVPIVFIVATLVLSILSATIKPLEVAAAVGTIVIGLAGYYATRSIQKA